MKRAQASATTETIPAKCDILKERENQRPQLPVERVFQLVTHSFKAKDAAAKGESTEAPAAE